jgi:hypothetical protein
MGCASSAGTLQQQWYSHVQSHRCVSTEGGRLEGGKERVRYRGDYCRQRSWCVHSIAHTSSTEWYLLAEMHRRVRAQWACMEPDLVWAAAG